MIFEKIRKRLEEEKQRLRKLKNDTITLFDSEVIAIEEQSYNFCKEIINQVEAEYNNGWIPCSERLPENISTVLVRVKGIEKPTIGWYGNMDNKWILSERDFADLQEFTVLAWQPLPEPYKKGE